MKKRILSLLLVMAMLLSIVPMVGATGEAAEQKFTGYNVFMQNSIAICFQANRAAIEEGFEKVEFYIGEELVQTRATLPEADEDGNVFFRCTKLTPAQMGEEVTAKLYISGEVKHTYTASIKGYCMTILNNEQNVEAWKNPELRTMLVDLLNYGAATQTFAEVTTPLVNADLSTEQKALATSGELKLDNVAKVEQYPDLTDPTVSWYGVGVNLKDSITLRYEFEAESVENLAIHFIADSLDAWVTKFEEVEGKENHYYAYFGMLDPTQLNETVTAVAYTDHYSSNRHMVSHKLLYSVESYAYAVANGEFSAELKALTDAMMRYGDSVCCWHNGHEYADGICKVCEKAKVFGMTTDTITIQAEDVVLSQYNAQGDRAIYISAHEHATNGKHIYMQNCGYTDYAGVKTAADLPGEVIIYVTPKVSGAYTVTAKTLTKSTGAVGYLIEDDTAATPTYSSYRWPTITSPDGYNASGASDFVNWEIGTATWTAGKTYAIRLLSSTSNLAMDEFVISHVHTYDDENDTTCNGCGEERHVHTKQINSDDTHHWYTYTCGCTDLDESKIEHSYTNGVCECGKQRVFVMNGTSIAINAEDAILNTTYVELITNNNVAGRKLVKLNNAHSAYINGAYVTSAEHQGDVIVYVTPSVTGTYKVEATGVYTRSVSLAGVLVEDDTTTSETKYTYKALPNPCSTPGDDFAGGSIIPMTYGTEYEWTAGKTYAIRVASGCARAAIDQFVITLVPHEHSYTYGVCKCGAERVFVMDGTSITINAQDAVLNTDYVSLISNNNVTGRKLVQLTSGHSAYINGAYVTSAEHPGDVVAYVTPSVSGTYSVVAKIVCTKKSTITGVMIEDISTEGTKYTYLALADDVVSNPANFTTGNITEVAILGDQEWTAGHTYAIRIAAGNTRTALDQFVITCTTPAE